MVVHLIHLNHLIHPVMFSDFLADVREYMAGKILQVKYSFNPSQTKGIRDEINGSWKTGKRDRKY